MAKHLGLELEHGLLISLHQQLLKTMEDREEREHLSQNWAEGLRKVGLLSGVTAGVATNDTQWDQNLACSSRNVPQHVSETQKCTPAGLRNLENLLQPLYPSRKLLAKGFLPLRSSLQKARQDVKASLPSSAQLQH